MTGCFTSPRESIPLLCNEYRAYVCNSAGAVSIMLPILWRIEQVFPYQFHGLFSHDPINVLNMG